MQDLQVASPAARAGLLEQECLALRPSVSPDGIRHGKPRRLKETRGKGCWVLGAQGAGGWKVTVQESTEEHGSPLLGAKACIAARGKATGTNSCTGTNQGPAKVWLFGGSRPHRRREAPVPQSSFGTHRHAQQQRHRVPAVPRSHRPHPRPPLRISPCPLFRLELLKLFLKILALLLARGSRAGRALLATPSAAALLSARGSEQRARFGLQLPQSQNFCQPPAGRRPRCRAGTFQSSGAMAGPRLGNPMFP